MAFLEVSNLTKHFGQVVALNDINLAVEKGGFLVLVGPSGCGKSTLLNVIAGLETMTDGEIRIAGSRVNELHPSQRDIAMVFQSYALYPNMNVARNITFGLEMRKVPKPQRDRSLAEAAKTLQIEHLLQRRPAQLSGGQRQRVAMGRALVRDPQVFLFDEPLSNLDAKLRVDMRTEIKLLHQRLGTTIVYVTHDQIEAMTLATLIAVMKDGVLQQVGTPFEIYNSPANMFVADFMGSPAMNLVPVTIRKNGNELSATVSEGATFAVPPSATSGLADYVGKGAILGIRPEAIATAGQGGATISTPATAQCNIKVIEPAGADTFVILSIGGEEVTARLPADVRVQPGTSAAFNFDMAKVVFFDPSTTMRVA